MTQNGQVFELQMQAHLISDSEFLLLPIPQESLLRTPIAGEVEGGAVAPEVAKAKGQTLRLSGQMIDMVAPNQLPKLPTPNTMDGLPPRSGEALEKTRRRGDTQGKLSTITNLREAVIHNLPTPAARDYKDGTAERQRDGKIQTDTVARAVLNSKEILMPTPTAVDGNTVAKSELDNNDPKHRLKVAAQLLARDGISWGKFEPAIRRWEETIGRPAPAPTKPDGKDGNHRLSSAFTEWMMGLPKGWITDCGLKRNEELKACGNGVVPQQAELALRILLEGIEIASKESQVNLPTPTVSDTFTDKLKSSQQKPGLMTSVTLAQAVQTHLERPTN
jgi:hypothetical protein